MTGLFLVVLKVQWQVKETIKHVMLRAREKQAVHICILGY